MVHLPSCYNIYKLCVSAKFSVPGTVDQLQVLDKKKIHITEDPEHICLQWITLVM